jgi:hypothetical protein
MKDHDLPPRHREASRAGLVAIGIEIAIVIVGVFIGNWVNDWREAENQRAS